jgi:CRP/FNR family transcriptional regulator, cyclic AMP receptor protein
MEYSVRWRDSPVIATDLQAALGRHPFLAGLDESTLELISSCAQMVGVPADQRMFHSGQPADAFYLILSGRVAVEMESGQAGHVCIQTIGPGEVLGWSALTPPYRWKFMARVLEPVRAVELNSAALRQLCQEHHELGFEVYRRLVGVVSERLTSTWVQLLEHLE